jgi:hypothetical protein
MPGGLGGRDAEEERRLKAAPSGEPSQDWLPHKVVSRKRKNAPKTGGMAA